MQKFIWITVFLGVLVWSGSEPKDYATWALEVAPAVIGGALLWFTRERFPLTPLVYALILIHAVILMIGGHYTYAEVPLFDGLFGAERNNYDKLGHLAQGFVPAMIAREVLIRLNVVDNARWRDVFIVSLCLAFSAFYEMLEWWVAALSGDDAVAFLATQGYQWDTQSDMALALLGAMVALATLSGWHDRQLERLTGGNP